MTVVGQLPSNWMVLWSQRPIPPQKRWVVPWPVGVVTCSQPGYRVDWGLGDEPTQPSTAKPSCKQWYSGTEQEGCTGWQTPLSLVGGSSASWQRSVLEVVYSGSSPSLPSCMLQVPQRRHALPRQTPGNPFGWGFAWALPTRTESGCGTLSIWMHSCGVMLAWCQLSCHDGGVNWWSTSTLMSC